MKGKKDRQQGNRVREGKVGRIEGRTEGGRGGWEGMGNECMREGGSEGGRDIGN